MLIVPSNITTPANITLVFYTPALGFDLTAVTAVSATVLRHDRTQTSFTFSVVSQTQTELVAQYEFLGGEITTTGAYFLAPALTTSAGQLPTDSVTMVVCSPFQGSPTLRQGVAVAAGANIPGGSQLAGVTVSGVYQAIWGIPWTKYNTMTVGGVYIFPPATPAMYGRAVQISVTQGGEFGVQFKSLDTVIVNPETGGNVAIGTLWTPTPPGIIPPATQPDWVGFSETFRLDGDALAWQPVG